MPSGGGPLVFVADVDRPVLDDGDRHHLSRALRLRDGDPLVLSDGSGAWRTARFRTGEPEPAGELQLAPRPAPAIEVAFALVKGSKPELAVQKLTELGVDRIRPFVAARSVVRWDAARSDTALVRLRRVAREASMQSRRAWLPEIDAVASFAEVAADPRACRADRGGSPPSLEHPLILTGPEGGWDDGERASELPVVALGDGVLRAETAAITAGVVLAALRSGLVRGA
ncbi:16S rRNA (uracil(1498)-N(3))-methyltransferase [soil metagenome]